MWCHESVLCVGVKCVKHMVFGHIFSDGGHFSIRRPQLQMFMLVLGPPFSKWRYVETCKEGGGHHYKKRAQGKRETILKPEDKHIGHGEKCLPTSLSQFEKKKNTIRNTQCRLHMVILSWERAHNF